jgi:hypothetical protein
MDCAILTNENKMINNATLSRVPTTMRRSFFFLCDFALSLAVIVCARPRSAFSVQPPPHVFHAHIITRLSPFSRLDYYLSVCKRPRYTSSLQDKGLCTHIENLTYRFAYYLGYQSTSTMPTALKSGFLPIPASLPRMPKKNRVSLNSD